MNRAAWAPTVHSQASGWAMYYVAMLNIDLKGKRALVAGVADDGGFGFAIAKALGEAGASVSVATWPPALTKASSGLTGGCYRPSVLEPERVHPSACASKVDCAAPRRKGRWRQTVTELRPATDTRQPQGVARPAPAPAGNALRSYWVEVLVEAPDGTATKLAALKLAAEAKP